jgi:hypothetical protein
MNRDSSLILSTMAGIWSSFEGIDETQLDAVLEGYLAVLKEVKTATATSEEDALYAALDKLIEVLDYGRTYIDLNYTLEECLESLGMNRAEVENAFLSAMSIRIANMNLASQVAEELEKIASGDCEKELLQGFHVDFNAALAQAGFSIYTPLDLVAALVNLDNGLQNCITILGKGGDYSNALSTTLATAKVEIWLAITKEVENEEILEDMKDQIEDAIEDILKEEQNQDVIAPDQEQNKENQENQENQDNQQNQDQMPPQDNQQNQNSNNGPNGTDNLDGLTFYNPLTGQNEVLTQESLNSFKEALDTAIENETFTSDQQDAMERYYELISQKFDKN